MSLAAKKTKSKKLTKQTTDEPTPVIGRPTKYDPKYCEQLITYMALPASFESFAGEIGVDRDTLYEWRKKHKEFSDAHKKGKMKTLHTFEKILRLYGKGQMKGNIAAVLFQMKNLTTFRDDPVTQEDESYDEMEFGE